MNAFCIAQFKKGSLAMCSLSGEARASKGHAFLKVDDLYAEFWGSFSGVLEKDAKELISSD